MVAKLQEREKQMEAETDRLRHRLDEIETKETKDERQGNCSEATEVTWESRVESLVRDSPHGRLSCSEFVWAWQRKFQK